MDILRREHQAQRTAPDIYELKECNSKEGEVTGVGPGAPENSRHEPGANYEKLDLKAR